MEDTAASSQQQPAARSKFIIGALLIIAAIAYLIVSSTRSSLQYFLTVSEVEQRAADLAGRDIRVSGAVLGDTIQYDADNLILRFTVVHVPGDMKEVERQGGMAAALHNATLDPALPRLQVVYHGVPPDLLQNEAQAIMTGRIGEDGIFTASELLLKCPSRYEEALPEQSQ